MAKWLTIVELVVTVASMFSLNDVQQKQLEDFASLRQNQWVEKRERDIEIALKQEAEKIAAGK